LSRKKKGLWFTNMIPLPVRLPAPLIIRLDRMAKQMSVSRSALIRLAVQQWIDAVENHGINPLLAPPSFVSRGELPHGDEDSDG